MAQASLLDSPQVTALDAAPPLAPLATGQGAPGFLQSIDGGVTALSGDTTSSVYKLVRVPTNAKLKSAVLYSAIATAGSGDINIAFSDSTNGDGTPTVAQGTIPQVSGANNKLLGAALSLVGLTHTELLDAQSLTNFPFLTGRDTPLWSLVGFTDDPGGYFDIQINITTAVTTGGVVYLVVSYVV